MRGRFYSPAWHRFINSDQGVDPTTFNQMAYVGGSPMQATDPSGFKINTSCTLVGVDWVETGTSYEWGSGVPGGKDRIIHRGHFNYRYSCSSSNGGSQNDFGAGGGSGELGQTPKLNAEKCAKIREMLAYERRRGTTLTARYFSPSFGGNSGLLFTNPTPYSNLTPTRVGAMDVDWFMELQGRMGWGPNVFGARGIAARGYYAAGKSLWEKMTSFMANSNGDYGEGRFQPERLYDDPGEGSAVWAAGQDLKFSDLWNEDWLKANCP